MIVNENMERSTSVSHETVRRITENDPTLTTVVIARESEIMQSTTARRSWVFDPNNRSELGKIGESIASNTALKSVIIHYQHFPNNAATATRSYRSFLSGFKRNSSIRALTLSSIDLSQGLGSECLASFKERNHPLREFSLILCDLGGGGGCREFQYGINPFGIQTSQQVASSFM